MSNQTKVAMIVPNACNPDFRVVKQAEALVRSGRTVRVYCTRPRESDLPDFEVVNGVEYFRKEWNVLAEFKAYLMRILGLAR